MISHHCRNAARNDADTQISDSHRHRRENYSFPLHTFRKRLIFILGPQNRVSNYLLFQRVGVSPSNFKGYLFSSSPRPHNFATQRPQGFQFLERREAPCLDLKGDLSSKKKKVTTSACALHPYHPVCFLCHLPQEPN